MLAIPNLEPQKGEFSRLAKSVPNLPTVAIGSLLVVINQTGQNHGVHGSTGSSADLTLVYNDSSSKAFAFRLKLALLTPD